MLQGPLHPQRYRGAHAHDLIDHAAERPAAAPRRPRRARGRRPSSSPSTPARAPSAPRRTAWRTSSSTSCSRAARSSTTTARSTRRPSGWAASLNAYTSHDLVAFHITVRAEAALEAIDLLTDFVGRPQHRRRRARPRARRRDPGDPALQGPAVGRRRAAHRPRGVRRPPARAARARPRGAPAHVHARRDRRLPRAPLGGRARRRVHRRQPRARPDATAPSTSCFERFPDAARARRPTSPAPRVQRRRRSSRSATRTSRTCGCSTGPTIDVDEPARARRAVDLLDAAGRLDGLAPVRRDPRAARPLLLRLRGRPRLRRRAGAAARRRAGRPTSASRPTRACARSSRELRDDGPDRGGGRARARLRRRPPRARLREHERRRALRRRRRRSSSARTSTPTRRSTALDA